MNRLDTRPETAPLLRDIDAFLRLSRDVGRKEALAVSMFHSRCQKDQSSWYYQTKESLQVINEKLGLGKFNKRRFNRILKMVEADINKIVDPILKPVLNPIVTVMLQEA